VKPMQPLPADWQPTPARLHTLLTEFGSDIDLSLSLRRFTAFYAEGQTSRDWDARFERWVIEDVERARARKGPGVETDDLGVPLNQRRNGHRELQPGDPGYVSPEQLAAWAQRGATA